MRTWWSSDDSRIRPRRARPNKRLEDIEDVTELQRGDCGLGDAEQAVPEAAAMVSAERIKASGLMGTILLRTEA